MTHDPLVPMSSADLDAIVESRRLRGLPLTVPVTVPAIGRLTAAARCWYVAEFTLLAAAARQAKQPDVEQHWRERAGRIAAEVAREFAEHGNAAGLRMVADALDRRHPEPPRDGWTPAERRVLDQINAYGAEHGTAPSQKQLRVFAAGRGVPLSKSRTSGVFARLPRMPREKPGPG